LKLGTISLDGTKVHADASKRKAVSYKRLLELETQLQTEVEELFALSEQSEQPEVPDGLVVSKEIARRQDRLVRLAEAKAVLEARAKERLAAEQAEYEEKLGATQGTRAHDRTATWWLCSESANDRSTRWGAVQLHRPRVTHHEKLDACRLRAGLQRTGGSRSAESAHRRMCPFQSSQR
jgi:hypothetical protein